MGGIQFLTVGCRAPVRSRWAISTATANRIWPPLNSRFKQRIGPDRARERAALARRANLYVGGSLSRSRWAISTATASRDPGRGQSTTTTSRSSWATATGNFPREPNYTVGTTSLYRSRRAISTATARAIWPRPTTNQCQQRIILLGTGTGSFQARTSDYPVGGPYSVAGRFQRRRNRDLAAANSKFQQRWSCKGNSQLSGRPNFPVGASPVRSRWAISTATACRIWPPLIQIQTTYRSSWDGNGTLARHRILPSERVLFRSPWAISTATASRIWPPLMAFQVTYRSSCAPCAGTLTPTVTPTVTPTPTLTPTLTPSGTPPTLGNYPAMRLI